MPRGAIRVSCDVMRPALVLISAIVFSGCSSGGGEVPRKPSAVRKAFPAQAWEAGTADSAHETPALLWNGLIGIRLNRSAAGDGLPFFAIDEYDVDGEEKIRVLPNPLPLKMIVGGAELSASAGADYRQSIDFRTGILLTEWNQGTAAGEVRIECRTVMHPELRQVAQQWKFLAPPGVAVRLEMADFAAGDLRVSTEGMNAHLVELEFGPSLTSASLGLRQRGGWEGLWAFDNRTIAWEGRFLGSKWLVFERTFALARSRNQVAMRAALGDRRHAPFSPSPTPLTFDEIGRIAADSLEREGTPDIEIEGPVDDQQAIRSFLYYLRTSIHPNGGMSVAPMGLSSATYFGHVFWDADIWVFPALMLVDPERARSIVRYRMERFEQAIENHRQWLLAGRPHGNGRVGGSPSGLGANGAKFPWESSVSGKETVPGPSRFQDHISGSVAWSINWAKALGLTDAEVSDRILQSVRTFFLNRMEETSNGVLELKGTMSPDEHHVGDNDLYTNVLATWLVQQDRDASPKVKLPQDELSFLTYDHDALRGYKQAAAVLAIYPLQYHPAERQAGAMMDRYSEKVTPNGPAMSDSVHALIWARIGEKHKAYETWRKSWKEFTNHPLMLFSEKRRKEVTYFTTGAAGCLQAVLYGFLGLRIDSKSQPGAAWSSPLKSGMVLSIKPNLPSQWQKATLKNVTVLGKQYTFTIEGDKVEVLAAE